MAEDNTFLQNFISAYKDCILFAEMGNKDESGGEPLDKNYSMADFSEDSNKRVEKDCIDFLKKATEKLEDIGKDINDYDYERMGHDFWFTRNGHGTGFWDTHKDDPYPEIVGDALDKIAKEFGECYIYISDDNMIELQ